MRKSSVFWSLFIYCVAVILSRSRTKVFGIITTLELSTLLTLVVIFFLFLLITSIILIWVVVTSRKKMSIKHYSIFIFVLVIFLSLYTKGYIANFYKYHPIYPWGIGDGKFSYLISCLSLSFLSFLIFMVCFKMNLLNLFRFPVSGIVFLFAGVYLAVTWLLYDAISTPYGGLDADYTQNCRILSLLILATYPPIMALLSWSKLKYENMLHRRKE